jgi:hypothetical protein
VTIAARCSHFSRTAHERYSIVCFSRLVHITDTHFAQVKYYLQLDLVFFKDPYILFGLPIKLLDPGIYLAVGGLYLALEILDHLSDGEDGCGRIP